MITTGDYWEIADSVHNADPLNYSIPTGFTCDRAETSKGFFSLKVNRNGFQGALYTHIQTGAKVLALAGTQGMPLNDLLADLRVLVQLMPRQATSALKFYRSAIQPGEGVTVVGHSLGGALAQVLGYWVNCRFVTFNAPGMAGALNVARFNVLKPQVLLRTRAGKAERDSGAAQGLNFVTPGDVIAHFGRHVGQVITLPGPAAQFANHGLPQVRAALRAYQINGQSLWDLDPFWVL